MRYQEPRKYHYKVTYKDRGDIKTQIIQAYDSGDATSRFWHEKAKSKYHADFEFVSVEPATIR